MKKIAILVAILLVVTAASAFSLGVGLSWGLPLDQGLPASNLMLSLKLDQLPFLLGIGFGLNDPMYVGLTADWWLLNRNLTGMLNIYVGPGLYFGLVNTSPAAINLGARLPVGLNIFPLDFLEFFIELAPTLAILPTLNFPDLGWQAAAGFRIWF